MKFLSLQFASLFASLVVAQSSVAQNTLISEDEALKNFKEAAKFYREGKAGETQPEKSDKVVEQTTLEEIPMLELVGEEPKPVAATLANAEPIEKTVVQINIENQTLENVVDRVVDSARETSGNWQVKWRLSPENNYIREERVNITAETDLNGFMKFLADRVNNMTGVQLFVTVFDKAHIIVISDTYY